MGAEADPGQVHHGLNQKYKAFRVTFAPQRNIDTERDNIPPRLQNPYMRDVSSEYEDCVDITVPIRYEPPEPTAYAYLAILTSNGWEPIAWGHLNSNAVDFAGVGKKQLYLPLYYNDHVQTALNYPFRVGEDGSCSFLRANSDPLELVLDGIAKDTPIYLNLMLYGRFEGANQADFSDAVLLHRIDQVKGGFYHTVPISVSSEYRYIRYVSPEKSRCTVAELEFYDRNGSKLTGTPIGKQSSNPNMVRENAFDGDINTAVELDDLSDAWIGLDLGEIRSIGKIRFLPRTNGKNIYEGHTYRLTFWDGQDWTTQPEQLAKGSELQFTVPANTIYYLQNRTTNSVGNYFIIENGELKWL